METLTMTAVVKVVTDLLMQVLGMFRALKDEQGNLKLPGVLVHGIVLAVSVGVMVGYDALYGVPFNVLELLKAAFGAIGLNEFLGKVKPKPASVGPQVVQ